VRAETIRTDHDRPATVRDCPAGVCVFVGCRYHLFLDVRPTGSVVYNFPDVEPQHMFPGTECVLKIVERHPDGMRLEEIGSFTNLTRERVRQIEYAALRKLHK